MAEHRSTGIVARALVAGALAMGLLAASGDAQAQDAARRPFVWGVGPGAGRSALSLGGRLYLPLISDGIFPVPTFDLNYVRGLADPLDYELRLSSVGVVSIVETGLRLRFAGDERFSLYGKLDVLAVVLIAGSFGIGLGASPGVGVSFGDHRSQLTLGIDTPFVLAGSFTGFGSSGSGAGIFGLIRPSATYEFPVSDRVNMFLQLQGYVGFFTADSSGGLGGSIINVAAGAVF